MRKLIGTTVASLVLAAASIVTVTPNAFADDAGIHDFMSQGSNSAAPTQPRSNSQQYRATYTDPAKNQSPATAPEKDPPYFNHAQGTMSSQ